MTNASEVLKSIKDNDIKYVDLRFTDPRGKMQHVTLDQSIVDEDLFAEGTMFDGSSIAGWKAINESDMTLMPDPETAVVDPFFAQPTLAIFCDILEPSTGEPYNRDPRTTAKKALAYLQSQGIGDAAYFGPEAEFFIFDDVRFSTDAYDTGFKLDSSELPTNTEADTRAAISATAVRTKGRLLPRPPIDSAQDSRPTCSCTWRRWACRWKASPRGGLRPARTRDQVPDAGELADSPADLQILHPQTAQAIGKTVTFMPSRSSAITARACMSTSPIWNGRQAGLRRQRYADLSEECLFYIGGILKHAKR
jgi:glutamine synthetase